MGSTTTAGTLMHPTARAQRTLQALEIYLDGIVQQARAAYAHAMRREPVRQQLHGIRRDSALDRAQSVAHAATSPAMTFVRQLVRLYRAGATPAELQQLAAVPLRAVEQLVAGEARCLDVIDLEETKLDGREDELQVRRRILMAKTPGVSPASLREEATLCDQACGLYTERARALRAAADRLERAGGLVA